MPRYSIVLTRHGASGIVPAHSSDGGVVVKRLAYGSPAYKAGIVPSTLIQYVDSRPVRSISELNDIFQSKKGLPVTVQTADPHFNIERALAIRVVSRITAHGRQLRVLVVFKNKAVLFRDGRRKESDVVIPFSALGEVLPVQAEKTTVLVFRYRNEVRAEVLVSQEEYDERNPPGDGSDLVGLVRTLLGLRADRKIHTKGRLGVSGQSEYSWDDTSNGDRSLSDASSASDASDGHPRRPAPAFLDKQVPMGGVASGVAASAAGLSPEEMSTRRARDVAASPAAPPREAPSSLAGSFSLNPGKKHTRSPGVGGAALPRAEDEDEARFYGRLLSPEAKQIARRAKRADDDDGEMTYFERVQARAKANKAAAAADGSPGGGGAGTEASFDGADFEAREAGGGAGESMFESFGRKARRGSMVSSDGVSVAGGIGGEVDYRAFFDPLAMETERREAGLLRLIDPDELYHDGYECIKPLVCKRGGAVIHFAAIARKHNGKDRRVLLITNEAVYCWLSDGKISRCFPLKDVTEVLTHPTESLLGFRLGTEHDALYKLLENTPSAAAKVLAILRPHTPIKVLTRDDPPHTASQKLWLAKPVNWRFTPDKIIPFTYRMDHPDKYPPSFSPRRGSTFFRYQDHQNALPGPLGRSFPTISRILPEAYQQHGGLPPFGGPEPKALSPPRVHPPPTAAFTGVRDSEFFAPRAARFSAAAGEKPILTAERRFPFGRPLGAEPAADPPDGEARRLRQLLRPDPRAPQATGRQAALDSPARARKAARHGLRKTARAVPAPNRAKRRLREEADAHDDDEEEEESEEDEDYEEEEPEEEEPEEEEPEEEQPESDDEKHHDRQGGKPAKTRAGRQASRRSRDEDPTPEEWYPAPAPAPFEFRDKSEYWPGEPSQDTPPDDTPGKPRRASPAALERHQRQLQKMHRTHQSHMQQHANPLPFDRHLDPHHPYDYPRGGAGDFAPPAASYYPEDLSNFRAGGGSPVRVMIPVVGPPLQPGDMVGLTADDVAPFFNQPPPATPDSHRAGRKAKKKSSKKRANPAPTIPLVQRQPGQGYPGYDAAGVGGDPLLSLSLHGKLDEVAAQLYAVASDVQRMKHSQESGPGGIDSRVYELEKSVLTLVEGQKLMMDDKQSSDKQQRESVEQLGQRLAAIERFLQDSTALDEFAAEGQGHDAPAGTTLGHYPPDQTSAQRSGVRNNSRISPPRLPPGGGDRGASVDGGAGHTYSGAGRDRSASIRRGSERFETPTPSTAQQRDMPNFLMSPKHQLVTAQAQFPLRMHIEHDTGPLSYTRVQPARRISRPA
ncbi:hypothetical protein DIPPA_01307 [Diplonema papillatum]|nr:hypothetical protein DIPPA_01307 [Diplonema papillatum]